MANNNSTDYYGRNLFTSEPVAWNPSVIYSAVAENPNLHSTIDHSTYVTCNNEFVLSSDFYGAAYKNVESNNLNSFVDVNELEYISLQNADLHLTTNEYFPVSYQETKYYSECQNLESQSLKELPTLNIPPSNEYEFLLLENRSPIVAESHTINRTDNVQHQTTIVQCDKSVPPDLKTHQIVESQGSQPMLKTPQKPKGSPLPELNTPNSTLSQYKIRSKVYSNTAHLCQPCGRSFALKRGLRQHIAAHHSGPRRYRCARCGKKFPLEEDLRRHENRHKAEFHTLQCDLCPKTFAVRGSLVRHLAAAHEIGALVCEFCGARKTRADHLAFHVWSKHKGKKPPK